MKKLWMGVLFFFMNIVYALPAPLYLNIPSWKNCTSTIVKGSAAFVCLPAAQPSNCPPASWKLLQNQNLIEKCVKN